MSSLAERLAAVHERIARAAAEAGRDPGTIRLVAISKFHPASAIREAYAAGQRHFGENYAQELYDKARELVDLEDLQWRFTGGLQRNKAKLLIEVGCVIETLSSQAHARFLHDKASAAGKRCRVLLQVNVLGEEQKGGVAPEDVPPLLELSRSLPSLEVLGLMTIPPADDFAAAEQAYRTVAALAQAHQLHELSMGMSDDLELAIRAGATSVRVGTAIFGPRPT